MATLPVTGYVVGGALSTGAGGTAPARAGAASAPSRSGWWWRWPRRALCAWAALTQQLLAAGGGHGGGRLLQRQRRRCTALPPPSWWRRPSRSARSRWVLAGGILGAVVGPNLASATRDVLPVPFAGAYAGAGRAWRCWRWLMMSFIRLPAAAAARARAQPGRPLREIARQPVFIVAVGRRALGYGVMNLLMAATPIAMAQCAHPFAERRAGARVARAGHVRAELLHRPPDQALRRAADHGGRAWCSTSPASSSRCRASS